MDKNYSSQSDDILDKEIVKWKLNRLFFFLVLINVSLSVLGVALPPTDKMMKHRKGCKNQTQPGSLTCLLLQQNIQNRLITR